MGVLMCREGTPANRVARLIVTFSLLTGWTACGTPAVWRKSTPGTCRGPLDLRARDIRLRSNMRKPRSVASLAYPELLKVGKNPPSMEGYSRENAMLSALECPRIASTDLDDLTCKTPLAVRTSGVAAHGWPRNAVAGAISGRGVSACCASATSFSKYPRAFWRSPAASAARAAP
jgi:hypothetical protein